jgi:hypothetical protein
MVAGTLGSSRWMMTGATLFRGASDAQQCVAAELRHPCRKRLPSSFYVGSRCIKVWLANVFRFDQGRRRPHNPLGGLSNVTVDEILALNIAARDGDTVTIEGRLIATGFFSYIAADLESKRGILVHAEPPITERLLQCAPASGGSHVIFYEPCVVTGNIAPCILPMFPAVVHGLTQFIYDGRRLVRDADEFKLDPPYEDDE